MTVNFVYDCESYAFSAENLFACDNVKEYIKRISKIKNLTPEEEIECAIKIKEGSLSAKRKLIAANLKLVVTIAGKVIKTSKLPMIDLIQEGNTGLMIAAEKFNYKFGYRFATYASWWVKQAMFKAISEQSHCFKIPVYIQETLSKYSKVKTEMEKELKRNVAINEVAEKMNTNVEKINNCLNAYKKTLSLEGDFEMKNGSEVRLADIIEDKNVATEAELEYKNLQNDINSVISTLKDREKNVIIMRFGLNGAAKQTLEDIGKIYGVTKECIRQTESRVLGKLKNNLILRELFVNYV